MHLKKQNLIILSFPLGLLTPSYAQSQQVRIASAIHPTRAVLTVAKNREAKPPRYKGQQYQWENDSFAIGKGNGSDRNYTNGLRYTAYYNYEELIDGDNRNEYKMVPKWIRPSPKLWDRLGFGDATTIHGGIAFGQNLYTPQLISIPTPVLDDRPYGAVLYGSHFVTFVNPKLDQSRTVELQLGFTGPPALGYIVQGGFHSLIGDENPNGWANQIHFEPIVNINEQSNFRKVLVGSKKISDDNVNADFNYYYGFNLGNLMTRGNAGFTVRAGQNIEGFPVSNIGNTISNRGNRKFRWYVFAGLDGHAVAHNIFLDGNTFQKSQKVNKKTGVYDYRLGFDATLKDWEFNYTFVSRSDEFSPRPAILQANRTRQNFGSLSLSRKVKF